MSRPIRWLIEYVLPPAALFVLVVLVWHVAARAWQAAYLLPEPLQVWQTAQANAGQLLTATRVTGEGALAGLGLSLLVGTAVAFVFSQSRLIQRAVYPYAIFLQTVPIIAIAPLVILWCGYGFFSVVVVAFILSLFPIINNVTAGLTTVDPNLLELFAIHNATRMQVLFKLRLPNAVPFLVAGARIACGLSVVGAIVGEIYAGSRSDAFGLGYLISATSVNLETSYLFAVVFCSTLLGVAIFSSASLIGATILARWHTAAGEPSSRLDKCS